MVGDEEGGCACCSTKVLALLELDVEEAVGAFITLVDVDHHGVRGQNLAPIDKQRDCRLLPQRHTLSDDSVELDCLEVVWDQKPSDKKRASYYYCL